MYVTFMHFYFREIQAATGEWIHDYLNRGLNKKTKTGNGNARLFVPFTAEVKKNIKRSWTISSETLLKIFFYT